MSGKKDDKHQQPDSASDRDADKLDKDLNEALKESFPASDAPAIGQSSREADRPIHRQTPVIDIESVRRLARKVK